MLERGLKGGNEEADLHKKCHDVELHMIKVKTTGCRLILFTFSCTGEQFEQATPIYSSYDWGVYELESF